MLSTSSLIDGPFDDRQLLRIVNISWCCLYVKYYFKGLNIFTVHIILLYLYKSIYYILIILNLPVIEEKIWLLDRGGGGVVQTEFSPRTALSGPQYIYCV